MKLVEHDHPNLARIAFRQRCFGTVRYGVGTQIAGYVTSLLDKDTLPGILFGTCDAHSDDPVWIQISGREIERWELRDAFQEGNVPLNDNR